MGWADADSSSFCLPFLLFRVHVVPGDPSKSQGPLGPHVLFPPPLCFDAAEPVLGVPWLHVPVSSPGQAEWAVRAWALESEGLGFKH